MGFEDFKEIKNELLRQVTMNKSSLYFPRVEMYNGFSKTIYKVISDF